MVEVRAVQFPPSAVSALGLLLTALENIGEKNNQRAQVSSGEKSGEKVKKQ